jgi:uncharacterized protein (DUF433 family)
MLQIENEKVPLTADECGEVRISGSRVGLDSVVDLFEEGASPEQIIAEYDSLKLDDVYAVLTYYLRHKEEVKDWLAQQERKAQTAEREIRARFGHQALRARILKLEREGHGDEAESGQVSCGRGCTGLDRPGNQEA